MRRTDQTEIDATRARGFDPEVIRHAEFSEKRIADFKHIANPHLKERLRTKIHDSGNRLPVMRSPEVLLNEGEVN